MDLNYRGNDFSVTLGGRPLIIQKKGHPFLYIGNGQDQIEMRSGNFSIEDYVTCRMPLEVTDIHEKDGRLCVNFSDHILCEISTSSDGVEISFEKKEDWINRLWIRLEAESDEKDYGCGEQFSYLNLRGRHFPLWTSEPGVGRDKTTEITFRQNRDGGSGGDYYMTYFPQSTFVSSRHYFFHTDCTSYADFDFRHEAFHELQFWAVPDKIYVKSADTFVLLLEKLSGLLGRQMELPDFVYHGLILGLQGGTERVKELTERTKRHGIAVAGLFCQDWCGTFIDPKFGKRLRWDFRWDPELYPDLPNQIKRWEDQGIAFLGYINPYLVKGGKLFQEAEKNGVLVKDKNGEVYLIHSVSIQCGIVDLSTERGMNWYRDVIKREMLDFGLKGWMADFGEYLPADCVLASGEDPKIVHNRYPADWAKCNYEACRKAEKEGKILFFMRSGASGCQKYTALQWQGDQSVDFTRHDGLPSAICGFLSLAMSGYGLSHSDIGGYTSVYDNFRTKELFERWTEMAVFSPVMRTHEGNRPSQNFQYYDDDDCMNFLARMVRIHQKLVPYIRDCVKINHEKGLAVQRPLFIHYEQDSPAYDIQDEYLLGRDVLVAPVIEEGAVTRRVYLPEDRWIGLFDGKEYGAGWTEVEAPIGRPPVFYRRESPYRRIFEDILGQE